ncbi:unnamed protein product [Leptidea sinapis]|uniref:Uncharacterized protein n=1 Tax=Leptidea sinapis TaxID=189913 RepID=A0A5E4PXG8_9NEOP|nr:unnamed protein product [Leptidea sinapis]
MVVLEGGGALLEPALALDGAAAACLERAYAQSDVSLKLLPKRYINLHQWLSPVTTSVAAAGKDLKLQIQQAQQPRRPLTPQPAEPPVNGQGQYVIPYYDPGSLVMGARNGTPLRLVSPGGVLAPRTYPAPAQPAQHQHQAGTVNTAPGL